MIYHCVHFVTCANSEKSLFEAIEVAFRSKITPQVMLSIAILNKYTSYNFFYVDRLKHVG